jgi:hypothetical protein
MENNASGHVELIPVGQITQKIYLIRGVKVMLDSDLAEFYQVPTKAFNQAVRRNATAFPMSYVPAHGGRGGGSKVTNCDLREQREGVGGIQNTLR